MSDQLLVGARVNFDQTAQPSISTTRAQRDAVSRQLITLHRRRRGRGPGRISVFQQGDLIVVLVRDDFTTLERTLVTAGAGKLVVSQRRVYSSAVRAEQVEIVEREMAVHVAAHLTCAHPSPEVAIDMFVLEPPPSIEGGQPPEQSLRSET